MKKLDRAETVLLIAVACVLSACGNTSSQSFEVSKCGYSVQVENVSKLVHVDPNIYRKTCTGNWVFYVPQSNPNVAAVAPTCGFKLNTDGTLFSYNDREFDLTGKTLTDCE